MGVTSPVLEILLLLETANFPFPTMDYSPWSSKDLIDRNRLKNFMQVEIDVTCMYTNFGGRDLSSFGDIATFRNGQFSFPTMDYSPWSSKDLIDRNRLKKFMQVEIDVTCMYTNLVGVTSPVSEILLLSETANFPFRPWTIVHGHQKI